jgi:sorting nexin-1/2
MVEATNESQMDAEEVDISPEVFEQTSGLLMNDYEKEFYVKNPQDNSGHIVYECKGRDSQGVWEGRRRYSEFHELYVTLCKRWPGIPIPALPPKKALGNKNLTFVQDRTYYLQRFMRKAARFTFIIESPEFMLFSRPQGLKIDAALNKMMPLTYN